jgi:putative transferase (TIGR04331 family)
MILLSLLPKDGHEQFQESLRDIEKVYHADCNLNIIERDEIIWNNSDLISTENLLKFESDFYLLFNFIFTKLMNELNEYHKLQKDVLWWKIILGPWMNEFIKYYLIRQRLISNITQEIKFDAVFIPKIEEEHLIPRDYISAAEIFSSKEGIWNTVLYKYILLQKSKKIFLSSTDEVYIEKNLSENKRGKEKLRQYLTLICRQINNNKVFMHKSFFPKKFLIRIMLTKRIYSFNKFEPSIKISNPKKFAYEFRYKKNQPIEGFTELENLYLLIKRFIPRSYLEDFKEHVDFQEKYWPQGCQNILTANSHLSSDAFKIYLSENMKTSRIVILQHGAEYGTSEFTFSEKFETEISNLFCTWGWESFPHKQISLGVIKNVGIKKSSKRKKRDILIIEHYIGFDLSIRGWQISDSHNLYKNFASSFIVSLKSSTTYDFRVRSLNHYYHHKKESKSKLFQNSVFEDVINSEQFSEFKDSLIEEASHARLNVCMTDSTPFLEILSMGYPVVGLWPVYFESYRQSVKEDFQNLKDVGIIWNSHEELLNFFAKNFHKIDEWWEKVNQDQRVVNFRLKYAKQVQDNFLDTLL